MPLCAIEVRQALVNHSNNLCTSQIAKKKRRESAVHGFSTSEYTRALVDDRRLLLHIELNLAHVPKI